VTHDEVNDHGEGLLPFLGFGLELGFKLLCREFGQTVDIPDLSLGLR
jgi:hypothetical protein